MEEPGIEYFNWYIGLHKTFMEVMLEDKYVKYDLHGYVIYLYNKLLMIEGRSISLIKSKDLLTTLQNFILYMLLLNPWKVFRLLKLGALQCPYKILET